MSETLKTTDHETIRKWVEERGGKPAAVTDTVAGKEAAIVKLMFGGDTDNLQEIGWEQFFEKFDEAKLALLYQEKTADGQRSKFNKLVSRD